MNKINQFSSQFFILKDIEHHFGFLLENGYKICDIQYLPKLNGNWSVQLKSQDCLIYLVQDRGYIEVSFAPALEIAPHKNPVDLEQMIFLVTKGQIRVCGIEGNLSWRKKQQFECIARLLKEYIDQISLFFAHS